MRCEGSEREAGRVSAHVPSPAPSCPALIRLRRAIKTQVIHPHVYSTAGWDKLFYSPWTGTHSVEFSDYYTWLRNLFNHYCSTSPQWFTAKQFSNTQAFKQLPYHPFWTSFLHCWISETRCWKPSVLEGAYRNLSIDLELIRKDHQASTAPLASARRACSATALWANPEPRTASSYLFQERY